jgi:predicted regulator of Ras-like GTPase activity (Roadblock/LC7/MglB family)
MTQHTEATGQLNWLLDDLVGRVPEMRHAIVLSRDGLLVGRSRDFEQSEAEHLSAVASGLQSLARGVGRRFDGGRVQQTVIELENLFLFVTAAGQGAVLAALAGSEVDTGIMAYEMNLLVKQVGRYLVAVPRTDLPGAPGGPGGLHGEDE